MNKKNDFTMNIGLPSIMLIFVVLCLVSFGILALVSANSDKKLSQKVLNRSIAYYDACNEAEEMLSEVDNQLIIAYENSKTSDEYYNLISNIPDTYIYKISDIQNLYVKLTFTYPNFSNEHFYKIDIWKVVTDDNLNYDTNLNLIEIY